MSTRVVLIWPICHDVKQNHKVCVVGLFFLMQPVASVYFQKSAVHHVSSDSDPFSFIKEELGGNQMDCVMFHVERSWSPVQVTQYSLLKRLNPHISVEACLHWV